MTRAVSTANSPTPQTFVSPDGSYCLKTEWDCDERQGVASVMVLQLASGEMLLHIWYAEWQGTPVFRGSVVEADFRYNDRDWRTRIDTAARTFVFHPNEAERPLNEMAGELKASFVQPRSVSTGRRKWRRRVGSICVILLNLVFVACAVWILVAKPPPVRPKDPWMAAGCIVLFGGFAVLETRSLWKNW